jgi:prepilin-type N-terminal cleavage/methylation domain-containing protein
MHECGETHDLASEASIMLRSERGMTAIEILIVLILFGILTFVAVGRLTGYRSLLALQALARSLAGDVRLTQQQAVARDENYRLAVTAGTPGYYRIERVADSTAVKQVELPVDVTLTMAGFTSNTVEFAATGAPLVTGSFCLTNTTGYSVTVKVRPATGRSEILDGLVEDCVP